jgi:hypothetical protein
MKLLGAELHDSLALWPNPRLAGTPGEIAPVLARPTLLAIVRLVRRHGAAQVAAANAALAAAGEIEANSRPTTPR